MKFNIPAPLLGFVVMLISVWGTSWLFQNVGEGYGFASLITGVLVFLAGMAISDRIVTK